MITPEAAREKLRRRYETRYPGWVVWGEEPPAAELTLHPPTQHDVLSDTAGAAAWVGRWSGEESSHHGIRLEWETRRWANMGTQRLPTRLVLPRAADVAAFIGRSAHWRQARHRADQLSAVLRGHERDAGSDVLRRRLKRVMDFEAEDFSRLLDVLDWLQVHPESGLFPRQVPVRGVDSKWIEKHHGLVRQLSVAATGRDSLGLRASPGLVRVRLLDDGLAPGMVRDFAAPTTELDQLPIRPLFVLVVENLHTFLAVPELTDAVVVHGAGYAVDLLAGLPWLRQAHVIYWGDLDVDGLRILGRLRGSVPQVRSILTDRQTLEAHLDLCGPDRADAPRGVPGDLTDRERDLFTALAEHGDVRFEQERVPWDTALEALHAAHQRAHTQATGAP